MSYKPIFHLALPYIIPAPPESPLVRPSVRYSTLRKLCLVSKSIYETVRPILYSNVFISSGNFQLNLLRRTLSNDPGLTKEIKSLKFVSRHRDVTKWDKSLVGVILKQCGNVEELALVFPTQWGLHEGFLSGDSLRNLKSLTIAAALTAIGSPKFHLESLSILPPFLPRQSDVSLSYCNLFDTLLSITIPVQAAQLSPSTAERPTCALSTLLHLSLSDSHHHPLLLSPSLLSQLTVTLSRTLESFVMPSWTHSHSYLDKFSCDFPTPLHPIHSFVSRCTLLKRIFIPNLGHLGVLRYLSKRVETIFVGTTRLSRLRRRKERSVIVEEEASSSSKVEELKTSLLNHHCRRRQSDVEGGNETFGWIVDLEGSERKEFVEEGKGLERSEDGTRGARWKKEVVEEIQELEQSLKEVGMKVLIEYV